MSYFERVGLIGKDRRGGRVREGGKEIIPGMRNSENLSQERARVCNLLLRHSHRKLQIGKYKHTKGSVIYIKEKNCRKCRFVWFFLF